MHIFLQCRFFEIYGNLNSVRESSVRKKKERGVKTNSRDSSKGSTSRSSVGKRQYKKAKIPLASHAGTLYLKHERFLDRSFPSFLYCLRSIIVNPDC